MDAMNAYEQYFQHGVLTANPATLVVMLYDGCIKNIKQGIFAIRAQEQEKANERLQKAEQILTELAMCLDLNFPIAHDLMNLYDFLLREMIAANTAKDAARLEPVAEMLSSLREAWQSIQKTHTGNIPVLEE
jgi:flagellar secretion chaperone FliS